VAHAQCDGYEIRDIPRSGIDGRRGVLFRPTVVVFGNRMQDGAASRMRPQRDTVVHDRSRELRVIGLGRQLDAATDASDDHVASS
jgi:hypothetical protein